MKRILRVGLKNLRKGKEILVNDLHFATWIGDIIKNRLLNGSKGDMYPWVDYTYNPLCGHCKHNCHYCYVDDLKVFPNTNSKYSGKARLHEDAFEGYLPEEKIFVVSCNDLFGGWVKDDIIQRILNYCKKFDAEYLFQTKNPKRLQFFSFPENTVVGTTIETNRRYKISEAVNPRLRHYDFKHSLKNLDVRAMLSIEPVIDFDLRVFSEWINELNLSFVSVGADSKNHELPEPSWGKVSELIDSINTEVKEKSNLDRLRD